METNREFSQDMHKTRRNILIVEDNELNREILASILEDEYNILEAENGEEGLQLLMQHYSELSLIILDVYMPVMNGFEFLEKTQKDALLSTVPVIVATGSDKPDDEVKCLNLGASDFVTKPYNPQVVLGRAHSIIKLKESVATLSVVEYDDLTGLYTMPAFCHHAKKLLDEKEAPEYDLAVLNLLNFKLVNSIFGEKKGDEVLTYIGKCFQMIDPKAVTARHGDKFYSLFPDSECPSMEEGMASIDRLVQGAPISRLQVKAGFYRSVDKTQPVSILCDRSIMAASSIKNDFTRSVGFYNEQIEDRFMNQQKMENDFDRAVSDREFCVFYQPKVDPVTETVVAAEALVRWIHKDGSMVSPGAFIPLFEKDGLISRLDEYMFRSVCLFQKKRLSEGKKAVPVSINLSRNSIYEKNTVSLYRNIVEEIGIPIQLVPIELTESAAIGGTEIQELADKLVGAGFSLHMDDFGTGYSSLSSLTTLPFDVIKLDKSLVDQIGGKKGNTVIRHTIEIAQELGMHVVAEGVEKEDQLDFLKSVGCDMIQGFYYSKPQRESIFEEMLENNGAHFSHYSQSSGRT